MCVLCSTKYIVSYKTNNFSVNAHHFQTKAKLFPRSLVARMYTIIGSLVRHVSTSEFARISFTIQYETQRQTQRGFDLSDVVDRSTNRAQSKIRKRYGPFVQQYSLVSKEKKITNVSVKSDVFSRVYARLARYSHLDAVPRDFGEIP